MATPEITSTCLAIRELGDGVVPSLVFTLQFNGVHFNVVAASPKDDAAGQGLVPLGYRFAESVEGKFLTELAELAWGEFDQARMEASDLLQQQLASLLADACLPTMRRLAPTPIPAAKTLQDYLYPQVYTLQVLTEGDHLTCITLDSDAGIPDEYQSVPKDRLRTMGLDIETTDIPVVKASHVILVRRLQGYVWRVTVDREDLVYKSLVNVFPENIGDELGTYLKLRSAGIDLKVPELRGIVQSHEGVIGILIGYIPHKHHNLRALLDGVEQGTIAPTEATASLRQKWATQIRRTLMGLHGLGILWLDIKTDNVLIDEDGDAVLIDFGGGNTMGWVDHDKYGSMEGELQGLDRIMTALGVGVNAD
ncbi:hypothetical protein C8A05DRAFT_39941 [Staphylotrichum tortipilum]|uniref:Protein kinase domain-containing protein n=1 Tax=Staphylotrichum tortipilum TaxID=2831512 RepID=A0AAN6M8T5_9PEZI|nr:hypothetical protein C8A05DRAFT_39941 [Staphylotrichum longicolle]